MCYRNKIYFDLILTNWIIKKTGDELTGGKLNNGRKSNKVECMNL